MWGMGGDAMLSLNWQRGDAVFKRRRLAGAAFLPICGILLAGCMTDRANDDAGSWVPIDAAERETRQMKAKRMRPAAINCRLDYGPPGPPTHLVKIKWVPNTPRVDWMWAIGDSVYSGEQARLAKRVGARKISSAFYGGINNRTGICTIWYAPPLRRSAKS